MGYHTNFKIIFFLFTTITSLLIISLQPCCAHKQFCGNKGIFAENGTYENNLERILSSLASNVSAVGGFFNVTAGVGQDKVYALAQCNGDLPSKKCFDCISSASEAVRTECSREREAILWGDLDECMVRYTSRDIFGFLELEPSYEVGNPNNVSTDPRVFNATLYDLVGNLAEQASSGSSEKFEVGSMKSNSTIYAMVQCTPDLSPEDCRVCLGSALDGVSDCCGGKEGGRFFRPSCFVWFEVFKFYDTSGTHDEISLSPPPLGQSELPSPPTNIQGKKSSKSGRVIIIIVVIIILVALLAIGCALLLYRRAKKGFGDANRIETLESLQFDFHEIKEATNNFSDANKLGHGGFGSVYKGKLSNGQEIAVKRLAGHSMQGEEQFMNEVSLLAKLQHRNLVRLLGFCSEKGERVLVYEFLCNGSLDHIIFDPTKRHELKWETRCKIICGTARGILYLHEDSRYKVIHRDLKASNVLLDENMNPKISDFGMARLFIMDQTEANTGRHMGTYGYMAPEYALHGCFSVKSDVFSFGVLVLEIVTARKNSWLDSSADVVHLLSYTWKNWREGNGTSLIDEALGEDSISEIMRFIHIGLLCVQENAENRPTMAEAVLMLTSRSATLPIPSRPAFYMYNSNNNSTLVTRLNVGEETESSDQSTSTNTTSYISFS